MTKLTMSALILLAVLASRVAQATGQYYESAAQAVPISNIVGSGSFSSSAYAPSAIRTYDNTTVYLYWMGFTSLVPGYGDEVFVYQAPNTWGGVNNAYTPRSGTPQPAGRILPDERPTSNPLVRVTSYFYGSPWAWTDTSAPVGLRKYRLLSLRSPDAVIFREMLYGVSEDGANFRWRGLIRVDYDPNGDGTIDLRLSKIAWREVSIGGILYWYGYTDLRFTDTPAQTGLGVIRARVDTSYSTDLPIFGIDVWTATGWVALPFNPAAGVDSFPWTIPANGSIKPKVVWQGVRQPSLHYAKQGASSTFHWELYGRGQGPRTNDCGCMNSTSTNPNGLGDRIRYRQLSMTSDNAETVLNTFPTLYTVESDTFGSPRCIPSDYDNGRNYPFLIEWLNNRVFYSATNDPGPPGHTTCQSDFFGQYIVRTILLQR